MKTRPTTSMFVTLLFTIATAAPTASAQQNREAEVLLQAAMQKELVEGELEHAVELYQKIVAAYQDDAVTAARAWLYLGRSYEKMGNEGARSAYRTVIERYPSQLDVVRLARAGLARLRESEEAALGKTQGVKLTEIEVPASEVRFAMSRDGNRLAYTDADGDLAIRDLRSGTDRKLVQFEEDEGRGWYPLWSPDDRRIAYQHFHNYWKQEIEIVSVETGDVQHTEINGYPQSWSRDGATILFVDQVFESSPRANLLPVEGGPARPLSVAFDGPPSLSPDGRYIAYPKEQEGNRDIYVVPVDGGDPARVTTDAARDSDPLWSPDGNFILFKSNRNLNQGGLWVIPMAQDRPAGRPVLVRPNIGDGGALSWRDDGKVLFTSTSSVFHLYAVDLDPSTRQVRGRGRKLTGPSEQNRAPAISPDGTRIAYLADQGGESVLRVMSIDGTQDREVTSINAWRGPIDWLNDDEVVLVARSLDKGEHGIYAVSTGGQEIRPIFIDKEVLGHVAVSPEGTRIAFRFGLQNPQLYIVGADGRDLRAIAHDEETPGYSPAWSPDGRHLAFQGRGRGSGIIVIDVDTGGRRQLVGGDPETRFGAPAWSPDGNHIVYHTNNADWDQPALWVASTGGATEPRQLEIDLPGAAAPRTRTSGSGLETFFITPRWSPDGATIVFVAGSGVQKLWIMEDFLPTDFASRN